MNIACTSRTTKLPSGIEIHHHEAGAGRPLVFVHGGGPGASGLSNYQGNHSYFASRGYRVLMPDLVGWGGSTKPADVTHDYDLLCGSLAAWLAALGISRCAITGNALGGAVAMRLALDQPDLVEKLVLIAPSALAPPETYAPMPGLQALIGMVRGPRPFPVESMRNLFTLMYHDPSGIDDRVVAERTQAAAAQRPDLFMKLSLPTLQDRLHEIRSPMLLFWGLSDRFCPWESSRNLLVACPAARMVAMGDSGHWVHVEKAGLFNRLALDFLEND